MCGIISISVSVCVCMCVCVCACACACMFYSSVSIGRVVTGLLFTALLPEWMETDVFQ